MWSLCRSISYSSVSGSCGRRCQYRLSLFFVGLLYFAGAVGWIFIGKKIGRLKTGFLVGTLWFFMPNNMHTLFLLGNLAEACAMIFLPVLIGFTYEWFFTEVKKSRTLAGMIVSQFFDRGMQCALQYFLWRSRSCCLAFWYILCIKRSRVSYLQLQPWCLASCFWAYGFIHPCRGDGSDTYNVTVMKNYFQSALQSLNPVYRLQEMTSIIILGWLPFY